MLTREADPIRRRYPLATILRLTMNVPIRLNVLIEADSLVTILLFDACSLKENDARWVILSLISPVPDS